MKHTAQLSFSFKEKNSVESAFEKSAKNDFKLVHISDPHLSRQYYREHIKSFKLLLKSAIEDGADHIVITGDIVSTADQNDFYLAREIFASMGILNSRMLTVVPGNHDIFGGPHRAVDVLSFPSHLRNIDYERHLRFFYYAFEETFEGTTRLSPTSPFPFLKEFDFFSLLGLNSIPRWSLWQNPLASNGGLCEQQIEILQNLSSKNLLRDKPVIAAIHHHFNDLLDDAADHALWKKIESKTMRMKKRKKIIKLFRGLNVNHVLHGHVHRNEMYRKGDIQFLNGAGAVCDDPIKFLKYNVITGENGFFRTRIVQLKLPYQTSAVKQPIFPIGKFRRPIPAEPQHALSRGNPRPSFT